MPANTPPSTRPLGWWTISGDDLFGALTRAHQGADPDLLYAEMYANSDVTDHGSGADPPAD